MPFGNLSLVVGCYGTLSICSAVGPGHNDVWLPNIVNHSVAKQSHAVTMEKGGKH